MVDPAPQMQATPATISTAVQVPWYSLDPRVLTRGKFMRAVFIGLVLVSLSVAPLWRLGWYYPVYSAKNFLPTRDIHGQLTAAWHWVDGKEIRIYAAPNVHHKAVEQITTGVKAMVDEVGLDMQVKVLPMPVEIRKAYEASVTRKTVYGAQRDCLSFAKLESQLITLRGGNPHADILIVNAPFTGTPWAHGMATFTSGMAVMQEDNASEHLGKHETCHLLGYTSHDSFPLWVAGYAGEGMPTRDTLMMLNSNSMVLSPRASDALRSFWRGLEVRSGKQFLR